MGVANVQTVIARLCLDMTFRDRFQTERMAALRSCGVSEAEGAALSTWDPSAVFAFGDALMGKRLRMIKRWLPLSMKALDCVLGPTEARALLNGYVTLRLRASDDLGTKWVLSDSTQLREFVYASPWRVDDDRETVDAVFRFECERLRLLLQAGVGAFEPGAIVIAPQVSDHDVVVRPTYAALAVFDRDIQRVIRQLDEARTTSPALCQTTGGPQAIIFVRSPKDVDSIVVDETTARIAEACTEPQVVGELIDTLSNGHEDVEWRAACREQLRAMASAGALSIGDCRFR